MEYLKAQSYGLTHVGRHKIYK